MRKARGSARFGDEGELPLGRAAAGVGAEFENDGAGSEELEAASVERPRDGNARRGDGHAGALWQLELSQGVGRNAQ